MNLKVSYDLDAQQKKEGILYQAIVEDINPDELETVGKISRFIKRVR